MASRSLSHLSTFQCWPVGKLQHSIQNLWFPGNVNVKIFIDELANCQSEGEISQLTAETASGFKKWMSRWDENRTVNVDSAFDIQIWITLYAWFRYATVCRTDRILLFLPYTIDVYANMSSNALRSIVQADERSRIKVIWEATTTSWAYTYFTSVELPWDPA